MSSDHIHRMASQMYSGIMNQITPLMRQMRRNDNGSPSSASSPSSDHRPHTNTKHMLMSMISSLESYIISLQSLLIWEKPYFSAVAFITFNCLFWVIVSWSRRFYSIIALIMFCITVYKLWSEQIWPEIRVPPNESDDNEGWTPVHPQVLSAPEINHYINESIAMINATIRWLINLRQTNHGLFFLLITGILIMTAIIGRIVPGVIIVYALMMTFALGPGIALYVIPVNWFENIRSLLIKKDENEDESDDKTRNDASLVSDFHEQTANELSLINNQYDSPQNVSYDRTMDDESSLQLLSSQFDTTLDEELGLSIRANNDDDDDLRLDDGSEKVKGQSPARSERSSQCSSHSNGIHFVTSHFSRNSSGEDIEDFELISDSEVHDPNKDLNLNS